MSSQAITGGSPASFSHPDSHLSSPSPPQSVCMSTAWVVPQGLGWPAWASSTQVRAILSTARGACSCSPKCETRPPAVKRSAHLSRLVFPPLFRRVTMQATTETTMAQQSGELPNAVESQNQQDSETGTSSKRQKSRHRASVACASCRERRIRVSLDMMRFDTWLS